MSLVPGLGIVRGMALTLRRFFEPKVTNLYPEEPAQIPHKFRGRLQLLYDEHGALKCETCFQCAQACPIECIDMGGVDTRGRFAVHWGASETYGERREESALRRSGRTVPDVAYERFAEIDLGPVDAILDEYDHDPKAMLQILEAIQEAYGHVPVAALKHVSQVTGAWYAMLYGTATYYDHLAVGAAGHDTTGSGLATASGSPTAGPRPHPADRSFASALEAALGGAAGGSAASAAGGPASAASSSDASVPGAPGSRRGSRRATRGDQG